MNTSSDDSSYVDGGSGSRFKLIVRLFWANFSLIAVSQSFISLVSFIGFGSDEELSVVEVSNGVSFTLNKIIISF